MDASTPGFSSPRILAYVPAGEGAAPLPAIVTSLALVAAGVVLWRARGWPPRAATSLAALAGFLVAPLLGAPEIVEQVAEACFWRAWWRPSGACVRAT